MVLIRLIISAIKSAVTSFLRNAYHTDTQILDTDMLEIDDLCHLETLLFLEAIGCYSHNYGQPLKLLKCSLPVFVQANSD